MRYRYARQLLVYNGHWFEWYPSDWAEQEANELGLLDNSELTQDSVDSADKYSGGDDESDGEEE